MWVMPSHLARAMYPMSKLLPQLPSLSPRRREAGLRSPRIAHSFFCASTLTSTLASSRYLVTTTFRVFPSPSPPVPSPSLMKYTPGASARTSFAPACSTATLRPAAFIRLAAWGVWLEAWSLWPEALLSRSTPPAPAPARHPRPDIRSRFLPRAWHSCAA